MLCYWGEVVRPEGFGLVKSDNVKKLRNGVAFISPKSKIRAVSEGSNQVGFIHGDGYASVLRLDVESAKLKNLDLKKDKIRLISCGEDHVILVAYGGKVFSMEGAKPCRPIKELSSRNVIQIACGNHHSIALTSDGQLFTWGQNSTGQLGLGEGKPDSPAPQPLNSLSGIPLAQISAGGDHSFALSVSGAVFCWGKNSKGQLGLGHTNDVYIPTCVTNLNYKKTIFVSCGDEHTATMSKGGAVFTFGSGCYGQLGHNSFTDEIQPRLVAELLGASVTQIACGRHHTLALVELSKKIYSFGSGKQGQLGNGQMVDQCVPVPVCLPSEASGEQRVQSLTAGGNHSFLLCSPPENSDPRRLRGIVTLGDKMINRWLSESDSNQWQGIKKEIKSVFSSTACLNGSFINRSCDAHYRTSTNTSGLDMESVRAAAERLAEKDKVLLEVEKVVDTDLLPSLSSTVAGGEALRVYLILPELFRVLNRHHETKLTIPLADAIFKLNPSVLTVLRIYWSELPDTFLQTLVALFRKVTASLISQIKNDYSKKKDLDKCLQTSACVLQMFYKTSCNGQRKISSTDFLVHEINDLFDMLGTIHMDLNQNYLGSDWITVRSQLLANEAYLMHTISLLILAPCIFDLEAKSNLVKFRQVTGPFRLELRRTALLEDCLCQLRVASEHILLLSWLQVVFRDDFKTSQVNNKDFFHEAFQLLLAPESKMFMYNDTKSLVWFPAEPSLPEERYHFLGMLCALAFYNNCVVHIPFPPVLFKKLLNIGPSLKDLAELSPGIAQSLQYVLDYPDDDVENMYMFYTIEWDNKKVELDPNEPGKAVTSSNKKQFVDSYLDYVLNKSVERVFEKFKQGFYKVCDPYLVALFTPEELRGVMVGTEQYDWDTLRKNATYEGLFYSNHWTILSFWEVFDELSECDKKSFLLFLTGFDRVPILGMEHVKMKVRPLYNSTEEHLPQALTCYSILQLPMYQTKKKLQEKLIEALHHKRGFWQE